MSILPMDGTRTKLDPTTGQYTTYKPGIATTPEALQRQAVVDQLAPPTAGATARGTGATAPAAPIGAPTTGGASAFNRGGTVKQLPGATKQIAEGIGSTAAGVGGQIASNVGKQAAKQAGSQAAKTGMSATSFGSGAAGAATSAGIGLATGAIADKLRVKEEMPTFGGEYGDLTDDYGRRFEGTGGGVASNAVRYAGYGSAAGPIGMGIGAGVGALVGALTKNAPSAYTDFRVEDAADAIGKAYEKYLGRPASEEEIKNQLVGQGWNPTGGDRWVGEKNLTSAGGVLDQIRNSPEAKAFRETGQPATARAAVVDQLGGGGGATSPTVPGSAPAPPGGGGGGAAGAPADPSGWDTDGYAAPQFTPQAAGEAPPGWDAGKWGDTSHQTPKYAVGRILSGFPPTVDGLAQAAEQVAKAYPGATFNGKDKLSIPGVGTIDVLKGASQGGEAWQWMPEGEGAAPSEAASASPRSGVGLRAGDAEGGDLLADLRAAIDRITRGEAPRAEMMQQLGGRNG